MINTKIIADLTEEEIFKISLLINREISDTDRFLAVHKGVLDINEKKPPLEDEKKEAERKELIQDYQKIVNMYTADLKFWQDLKNKFRVKGGDDQDD
jgi:hypothetical protein